MRFGLVLVFALALLAVSCGKGTANSSGQPAPGPAPASAPASTPQSTNPPGNKEAVDPNATGCRKECLNKSPYCFHVDNFKKSSRVLSQFHSLAEKAEAVTEYSFDMRPYRGKFELPMKAVGTEFRINGEIKSPDQVHYQRADTKTLELIVTPQTAPELILEVPNLNKDWGGKLRKIEFIDTQPVFNLGDQSCLFFSFDREQ